MTPNEFRHIRLGLCLTQAGLASRLGYSSRMPVTKIETGQMGISHVLERLMRAYEIMGYAPDLHADTRSRTAPHSVS